MQAPLTRQTGAEPGAPLRVLIADDNRDNADSTADLLQVMLPVPCETEVVYDGAAALAHGLAQRPDAVLLDLQMPGLSGVEVARRLREHYGPDAPYLVAMTGDTSAVRDLPAIDAHFDRVFAKPLHVDELESALTRLSARQEQRPRVLQRLEPAELFTQVVRRIMPGMPARRLALSFDWRGPGLVVEDDPVQLQCGLHRLLLGLLDVMSAGFVMFNAKATADDRGGCAITVEAAGMGTLRPRAQVDEVLRRLNLGRLEAAPDGDGAISRAEGVCPNTGGRVTCSWDAHEGVLLSLQLHYEHAQMLPAAAAVAPVQARAWLIDESATACAGLQRRLQRLGWAVTRLPTCEDALALLHDAADDLPTLLVVVEAAAGNRLVAGDLQRRMPASTQCVYAVLAGSPVLAVPGALNAYAVRVLPFSVGELAAFCQAAADPDRTARAADAPVQPAPRGAPVVLLVDDNEINRLVGTGLLEALGYEVRTAHDGLDAIDKCRQSPPQIVLMDVQMPVLPGIEATQRIRELQRLGEVAPFAVVAATADASPDARIACREAGMDGFLSKPLDMRELEEQLRRFTGFA